MDIERSNVSRKNEGKKFNGFKNLDYKIIPFIFKDGKNFLTKVYIFSKFL